jgi:hypothetical protein
MELYIIVVLLCFIILLYFVDELKLIYVLNVDILNNSKIINKSLSFFDKSLLLYNNPYLIKLYKKILNNLKKINKYDIKSYYSKLDINLPYDALIFMDWFSITYGIIKLSQDTIIKLIKLKENISTDLIYNINKLYNYYLYIEKIFKNINISQLNKYKNKKYKNDSLIKLIKIEELLKNLFIKYHKILNIKYKSSTKSLFKSIIQNREINLINLKLNLKLNKNSANNSNISKLINFFN